MPHVRPGYGCSWPVSAQQGLTEAGRWADDATSISALLSLPIA
jgi:hypothetical protein